MNAEYEEMTDDELARQTRAGSLVAFEALVARYQHRVFAFVSQSCPNHADAAEITQDTFLKAFKSIARYNPKYPFHSWLLTIARRKAIDHHRASPPIPLEAVPDCPGLDDPAEQLARREDHDDIWAVARRHLSELQYQVLWLRYAEDLDVAEIAVVTRKTRTYVKVALFRARQLLSRRVDPAGRPALPAAGAVALTTPPAKSRPPSATMFFHGQKLS